MPPVTKQRPPAPTAANGKPPSPPAASGAAGRIRPVKSAVTNLLLSLYGRPKTGKTRLACTFPPPGLIIGTEDGTASVIGVPGWDFVLLERCEEIVGLIDGLAKGELTTQAGKRYASIVFDNGTGFRDQRISEILGLERAAVQKGYGFANRDQWMECSQSMKELLRPLLWLGRQRDYNVVVIAQEQNLAKEESNLIDMGPALGKSVADWINAECDYIGQTCLKEQQKDQSLTVAGVTTTKKVGTGKYEYSLRVAPSDVYRAGFRVPLGVKMDVEFLADPSYAKILDLIRGNSKVAAK